ncbi:MAG: hypothetical protein ACLR6J_13415 [Parabacteroides merdae]
MLQIDPANTKGVTDMALACAVAPSARRSGRGIFGDYYSESPSLATRNRKDLKEQRDTTTLCRRVST